MHKSNSTLMPASAQPNLSSSHVSAHANAEPFPDNSLPSCSPLSEDEERDVTFCRSYSLLAIIAAAGCAETGLSAICHLDGFFGMFGAAPAVIFGLYILFACPERLSIKFKRAQTCLRKEPVASLQGLMAPSLAADEKLDAMYALRYSLAMVLTVSAAVVGRVCVETPLGILFACVSLLCAAFCILGVVEQLRIAAKLRDMFIALSGCFGAGAWVMVLLGVGDAAGWWHINWSGPSLIDAIFLPVFIASTIGGAVTWSRQSRRLTGPKVVLLGCRTH